MERHLRDRAFYGMHKTLRAIVGYLYDDFRTSYTQLMVPADKAEIEALNGNSSVANVKSKAATAASKSNTGLKPL